MPPEHWDPKNLDNLLEPIFYTVLNSWPSICMGDVLPRKSSVDRLAEVVEGYVQSTYQRQYKDPSRSSELPDPVVDLDIYDLPPQVRDRVLMSQRPNHFLRTSELSFFDVATSKHDHELEEENHKYQDQLQDQGALMSD